MPVLTHVSYVEADALAAANIDGYENNTLTYDPRTYQTILAKLPVGEARNRLSERMASIAIQLGIPEVMFSAPADIGDAKERHGAIVKDDEIAVSPSSSAP